MPRAPSDGGTLLGAAFCRSRFVVWFGTAGVHVFFQGCVVWAEASCGEALGNSIPRLQGASAHTPNQDDFKRGGTSTWTGGERNSGIRNILRSTKRPCLKSRLMETKLGAGCLDSRPFTQVRSTRYDLKCSGAQGVRARREKTVDERKVQLVSHLPHSQDLTQFDPVSLPNISTM